MIYFVVVCIILVFIKRNPMDGVPWGSFIEIYISALNGENISH